MEVKKKVVNKAKLVNYLDNFNAKNLRQISDSRFFGDRIPFVVDSFSKLSRLYFPSAYFSKR